jgi:hypothetical protein
MDQNQVLYHRLTPTRYGTAATRYQVPLNPSGMGTEKDELWVYGVPLRRQRGWAIVFLWWEGTH